jgi:hypothetical protein
MADFKERRAEKRLRYHWPIWFAEDTSGQLSQGQMVDICSNGAAFSCYADHCPWPGQWITARFSVPQYGQDNSFDLSNHVRSGSICRVDEVSPFLRRVAIRFVDSLPFKPGEQDVSQAGSEEELEVLSA